MNPFLSLIEQPNGLMKKLAYYFTRRQFGKVPFAHALGHQQKEKSDMKSGEELHQELRRRILSLPGVTERQNAGIHEDAFFVGRTMFVHIHGHGHCDIRLAKSDQARVLAKGEVRQHRWAPEKGYVTFVARDENDLAPAMELIRMSHDHFAASKVDEQDK
jgi:hypothetical protein